MRPKYRPIVDNEVMLRCLTPMKLQVGDRVRFVDLPEEWQDPQYTVLPESIEFMEGPGLGSRSRVERRIRHSAQEVSETADPVGDDWRQPDSFASVVRGILASE